MCGRHNPRILSRPSDCCRHGSRYLGRLLQVAAQRHLSGVVQRAGVALRLIANKNLGSHFLCTHTILELTSLCPETRIPDFYKLSVEYLPGKNLIELKSLKQYLDGYRQRELYHEELLNEVFRDFVQVVRPKWARLRLEVNIRGGTQTVVTRETGKATTTRTWRSPERGSH